MAFYMALFVKTAAALLTAMNLVKFIQKYDDLKAESLPICNIDSGYQQELVDMVNEQDATWVARLNPYGCRAYRPPLRDELKKTVAPDVQLILDSAQRLEDLVMLWNRREIPPAFDARSKWSYCESIHNVRDQASCGSCWATSISSVISDRICIASNGLRQPWISEQDLIDCCPDCGGCAGGNAIAAFNFWKTKGIVSGGVYGSSAGCLPYQYKPNCGHPCPREVYERMEDLRALQQSLTPRESRCKCHAASHKNYTRDKHFAEKVYWLGPSIPAHINLTLNPFATKFPKLMRFWEKSLKNPGAFNELMKLELLTRGPFIVGFLPREDFQHYRTGIYQGLAGEGMYTHIVKVVGWSENINRNQAVWIVANSWGSTFGEKGFFQWSPGTALNGMSGVPKLKKF